MVMVGKIKTTNQWMHNSDMFKRGCAAFILPYSFPPSSTVGWWWVLPLLRGASPVHLCAVPCPSLPHGTRGRGWEYVRAVPRVPKHHSCIGWLSGTSRQVFKLQRSHGKFSREGGGALKCHACTPKRSMPVKTTLKTFLFLSPICTGHFWCINRMC